MLRNRFDAFKDDVEYDIGAVEKIVQKSSEKHFCKSIDVGSAGAKTQKTKRVKGTITFYSGAGANCWPAHLLPTSKLLPRMKGVKFIAAQGSEMKYFGTKSVRFRPLCSRDGEVKEGNIGEIEFHVTDSTKPLVSAAKLAEAGNTIVLSGRKGGSFIENEKTKERIYLRREKGTYVFDVIFEAPEDQDVEMSMASPFTRQE